MGILVYSEIPGHKDSTRLSRVVEKSRRDLIFVTRTQNTKKNPIGIQCF